jgi:hypothetical protein
MIHVVRSCGDGQARLLKCQPEYADSPRTWCRPGPGGPTVPGWQTQSAAGPGPPAGCRGPGPGLATTVTGTVNTTLLWVGQASSDSA